MKTQTTTHSRLMSTSVIQIGLLTLAILALPFISMQLSNEVNWGVLDFVIAGIGIFTTGMLYRLIVEKAHPQYRTVLILALGATFVLIWVELAVGIFGTPFAGS